MEYTNLEQSKELMELGLKPETADLVWFRETKDDSYQLALLRDDIKLIEDSFSIRNEYALPAWTTDALLREIPTEIRVKDAWFEFYLSYKEGYWYAAYRDDVFDSIVYRGKWSSPVDMLADIMKWLLENKYKNV